MFSVLHDSLRLICKGVAFTPHRHHVVLRCIEPSNLHPPQAILRPGQDCRNLNKRCTSEHGNCALDINLKLRTAAYSPKKTQ